MNSLLSGYALRAFTPLMVLRHLAELLAIIAAGVLADQPVRKKGCIWVHLFVRVKFS